MNILNKSKNSSLNYTSLKFTYLISLYISKMKSLNYLTLLYVGNTGFLTYLMLLYIGNTKLLTYVTLLFISNTKYLIIGGMFMKIIQEFKEFINRGNVIDLAVGVILGGAFNQIVSSLVDDIITPIIGIFLNQNFKDLKLVINNSEILYGIFIQNIVNFFLVSIAIFIFIKLINSFRRKKEVLPQEPTQEELLLSEIRDILKKSINE